jgi:hypothetical protein
MDVRDLADGPTKMAPLGEPSAKATYLLSWYGIATLRACSSVAIEQQAMNRYRDHGRGRWRQHEQEDGCAYPSRKEKVDGSHDGQRHSNSDKYMGALEKTAE